MKFFRPARLLLFAAVMAAVCCALAAASHGYTGVASLAMVSFFMSLMSPLSTG
jgi:fucose permease